MKVIIEGGFDDLVEENARKEISQNSFSRTNIGLSSFEQEKGMYII